MKQTYEITNRTEWLKLRAPNVNSTEVAALFGAHPRLTQFELWCQKKDGDIVEIEPNELIQWGTWCEDSIARGLYELHKEELSSMAKLPIYIWDNKERRGSSFDYAVGTNGLLEIKLVIWGKKNWIGEGENTEAPPEIELQVQNELDMAEKDFIYIGAWFGGSHVFLRRNRNEKVIKAIREKTHEFWESIESNTPPSPNFEKDAARIQELNSLAIKGKEIPLDSELYGLGLQLRELREEAKKLRIQEEALRAQIIFKMGDAAIAVKGKDKIKAQSVKRKSYVVSESVSRQIRVDYGDIDDGDSNN